jgi:Cupredoxin-like domain
VISTRRLAAGSLLALAVVAGCGQGAGSSASPVAVASAAPSAAAIPVHVLDFKIEPVDVKAPAGHLDLAVDNAGPTVHNVTVRDANGTVIAATKDLKTGGTETISTDLKTGSYILFCSLPGHESLGTKAALEVGP